MKIYDDFFEEVKKFKEKQEKQKQRGLNDYNILNAVRKETAEVGMHSNVIFSLINPNGLHYQGDLFLQLFIQEVLIDIRDDFGEIVSVEAEESTFKNRRIDFTIKSTKYYIGIEMKIDADDLENQIGHYYDDLCKKAEKNDINKNNVIVYYLTKNGKDAPPFSYGEYKGYKKISFKKNILNWVKSCQKEVQNITNLNEAFENYKDIIKKITDTSYKGNIMQLENYLFENQEKYRLAKDINKAYIQAFRMQKEKFLDDVEKAFSDFNPKYTKQPSWRCIDINRFFQFRFSINDKHGFILQITEIDTNFQKILDIASKQKILIVLNKIDSKFDNGWDKAYSTYVFGDIDEIKVEEVKKLILNLLDNFANRN